MNAKEYSVRYSVHGCLISICAYGKTVKYTYVEAIEKAKKCNENPNVKYCKIYKGRTLIETIKKQTTT